MALVQHPGSGAVGVGGAGGLLANTATLTPTTVYTITVGGVVPLEQRLVIYPALMVQTQL